MTCIIICGFSELVLIFWNLIKRCEEEKIVLQYDYNLTSHSNALYLSGDFTDCAFCQKCNNESIILLWKMNSNYKTEMHAQEIAKSKDPSSNMSRRNKTANINDSTNNNQSQKILQVQKLKVKATITVVCFTSNSTLTFGTISGMVVTLSMETELIEYVLTKDGLLALTNKDLLIDHLPTIFSSPHHSAVIHLEYNSENNVLLSTCGYVVCISDLTANTVLSEITLNDDEQVRLNVSCMTAIVCVNVAAMSIHILASGFVFGRLSLLYFHGYSYQ